MSNTAEGQGRCLCGKVGVTAPHMSLDVGVCHCRFCRRWSGGPAMAVDCGSDVRFTGAEYIKTYDSSAWAERGFCANCGSHLFYRLKEKNQYILPVGLFEGDPGFALHRQVFIDEKPAFYCFANETHNMTGKEVIALYASPQE